MSILISNFAEKNEMICKIYKLLLFTVFYTSCCNTEHDQLDYNSCLEKLVMNYTSLDEISAYTGLSSRSLIEEKIKNESVSPELTKTLNEVLNVFSSNYNTGKKHISEQKSDIIYRLGKKSTYSINVNELQDQERILNEQFQNTIYNITSEYIIKGVESSFSQKYSLLNIPQNIWFHFTSTDKEVLSNFQNSINNNIQIKEVENIINSRIEAWSEMLSLQHQILEDTLPLMKNDLIKLDNYNQILIDDPIFVERFKARNKKEIASFTTDIIVSGVFSLLIFFFMNLLRGLRRTDKNKAPKIVTIPISIIVFIICFYFFDYKSLDDNLIMENIIYNNYSDYMNTQNLYVLEILNNYIE